ncbi:18S rRNA maturation protein [Perkinsus olseni]|uniref:rRNA-processing protein EFG1 n=1 Tax=Perkinsus olseni TaxID=32597 RepID=A0A7J6TMC3_PEROL|nr:18S rRNA maturation protein [Perkinsus olseni]
MDEKASRPRGRPSTEAEDKLFEKYKYVRFVERQKVERKLKTCRRQLAEIIQGKSEADPQEIQGRMNGLLEDLQYIKFYPHGEKYISLFPKDGKLKPREMAKQKSIRESIRNRLESQKEIDERTLEKRETKETVEHREEVDDFFADGDANDVVLLG